MGYINYKNRITIEITSSEFRLADIEKWSLNCSEMYIKRYPHKIVITFYNPNEVLIDDLEDKGLIKR